MADDPPPDLTIWPAARAAIKAAVVPKVDAAGVVEKVDAAGIWRSAITAMIKIGKLHPEISTDFHDLWTESGHRIREQVLDDDLLRDALRILLPVYVGPGLKLYRGESVDRWKTETYGFAWTDKIDIARMFARGLNAMADQGGVLLSADAPTEAIIAGHSDHTIYLQEYEYVIDWRQLRDITPLERFPPSK